MPTRSSIFDENPSLEGPDYVALVIEWDELADTLEHDLRFDPSSLVADAQPAGLPHSVKIAAGALGAIALVWAIVHRIRA